MAARKNCICLSITGVLGLAFLVAGCVLIRVFDTYIHRQVDTNLVLKNGSTIYDNWISTPVPVYFQVWVFHVDNMDEIVNSGAKPYLVERGPYTYRETLHKGNVEFVGTNRVRYRETKWFYFDRDLSVGPESDTFTTINLPMITIANMLRFEYGWIKELEDLVLDTTGEHLFLTLSVKELLWGYEDSLLKDVKRLLSKFGINSTLDDRFGLFRTENGTDQGLYEIYTGSDDIEHFAEIVSWNGFSSLPFWTSDTANMINGSSGTLYPPFIDTSRSYYFFSRDLCRSVEIVYSNSYELKGIQLSRFTLPSYTLANVSVNPYNKGFCTPTDSCLPAGLLNASVCREEAPIVYSYPHFLDGDPEVQNRVLGMRPDREEHQCVLDIEPITGMVMSLAKRLQVNVYLQNMSHIQDTRNIRDYVIFPVLWVNESAMLDDKTASDFRKEVQVPLMITKGVQFGLIALGALFWAVLLLLVVRHVKEYQKTKRRTLVSERSPIITASEYCIS